MGRNVLAGLIAVVCVGTLVCETARAHAERTQAQQIRASIQQAEVLLRQLQRQPPPSYDEPAPAPAVQGAVRGLHELERAQAELEILRLRLELQRLTGEPPLPSALG